MLTDEPLPTIDTALFRRPRPVLGLEPGLVLTFG